MTPPPLGFLSWTPLLLAAIVVLIDVFSIMPPASAAA
jgi:hypothetical protein